MKRCQIPGSCPEGGDWTGRRAREQGSLKELGPGEDEEVEEATVRKSSQGNLTGWPEPCNPKNRDEALSQKPVQV